MPGSSRKKSLSIFESLSSKTVSFLDRAFGSLSASKKLVPVARKDSQQDAGQLSGQVTSPALYAYYSHSHF